ncbi:DOPA-like domain-containing protein, partial [Blyttiomyces helicus]
FHFHVYWLTRDAHAKEAAYKLRDRIIELNELGFFVAVPLAITNDAPVGPHPVGSYEVWVPTEYFARAYSWMIQNRPENLSIFVHPLTKMELQDHTTRATFLGPSYPLYTEHLEDDLKENPRQYPELGLGYSRQ